MENPKECGQVLTCALGFYSRDVILYNLKCSLSDKGEALFRYVLIMSTETSA